MVFAKQPQSPLVADLGVKYVLRRNTANPPGPDGDSGMTIEQLPNAPGRATIVTQDGGHAGVEWLEDEATRVRLAVDAPSPAVLTLADELFPGWAATVDGAPAPIDRANRIFRRVSVPAGRHTVSFSYVPSAFRTGLYLMLVGLALGAFTICFVACAKQSRTAPGALSALPTVRPQPPDTRATIRAAE